MAEKPAIKARDRDVIVSALRAGVVPRLGLQHIQVGRKREIEALVRDVDRVAEGGSTVRFVIGTYGAGKTFFLFLIRQIALRKKLLVMQADLGPQRRIFATGGEARGLYAELVRSLATTSSPDGNALRPVIESFISDTAERSRGRPIDEAISSRLSPLRELVSGYDFAAVIATYARAFDAGNEPQMEAALRWLRGEYSTKTQAREELGVRTIIDDSGFYDGLRLFAKFARVAGYGGLLVCLDEMVNLYKLQSAQARKLNYEQILRILNDALQGTTEGLGVIFGGTPDFLMDTRRGLYSYEALQSRLAANSFASNTLVDLTGPVIHLQNLTVEELLHLLERLRSVFALGDPGRYLVPDEGLHAFLEHCRSRIGDAYFQTPRNTIKSFVDLLAVLEQNPGISWRDMIEATDIARDNGVELDRAVDGDEADGDDLATLKF
jgi:hypothetical protein